MRKSGDKAGSVAVHDAYSLAAQPASPSAHFHTPRAMCQQSFFNGPKALEVHAKGVPGFVKTITRRYDCQGMAAQDFAHARGATLTEEYVPTPTASQPDPQWYIAKMRDLYERDPQLLDPSWRAYFSTESAPPQLRAKRPAIPEGAIEDSAPEQAAPASSL